MTTNKVSQHEIPSDLLQKILNKVDEERRKDQKTGGMKQEGREQDLPYLPSPECDVLAISDLVTNPLTYQLMEEIAHRKTSTIKEAQPYGITEPQYTVIEHILGCDFCKETTSNMVQLHQLQRRQKILLIVALLSGENNPSPSSQEGIGQENNYQFRM